MRWATGAYKRRQKNLNIWFNWFAWYPVKLDGDTWIWWEPLRRRICRGAQGSTYYTYYSLKNVRQQYLEAKEKAYDMPNMYR
ncbi:MAG: hypothetical protein V3V00_10425 [Saprospiraceae bacterium]